MTETTLIFNANIYTPTEVVEEGWLLIEQNRISEIGSGQRQAEGSYKVIDAQSNILIPGMVDLHAHGALGHEVMDADPQGILEFGRFMASNGVTSFLGATWASRPENILPAMRAVDQVRGKIPGGAWLQGVYLEGPFLNPDRCGAQDPELIRTAADHSEALAYLDLAAGLVKVVVLAPEFEENAWLIEACVRRGITVSAGHTSATYDQMRQAVQHGVRELTHCFNAMSPLHHREPGVVGAGLLLPELHCELIADNIHVHPAVQKVLYQARGSDGILLVSDCTRCTGLPEGDYDLDGRTVTLKNGSVRLPDGTLAGSVLTLDRALGNFMLSTGAPLEDVLPSATTTPAALIGIDHCKAKIQPGYDADLVLMDHHLRLLWTMVDGEVVWERA